MAKIVISFTVEKSNTDGQFKGTIILKNEKGDEVSFNFIWQIPEEDKRLNDINIKFSNNHENFDVNRLSVVNLTKRQKIIFGLSMMIVPDMIDEVKISKIKATNTIFQEILDEVYKIIF